MTYEIKIPITSETLMDCIVSVCEGGYSPWVKEVDTEHYGSKELFEKGDYKIKVKFDRPLDQEGAFKGRKVITRATVKRGLQAFGVKCPRGLASLLDDNWDAITMDCLFQCIVFGEVVYG